VHVVTWVRDLWRYSARGPHRLIVNLCSADDTTLRRLHPHLTARSVVIGNGVDTTRFCPSTSAERIAARAALSLDIHATVLAFVGHEFDRKGLTPLLEAVARSHESVCLVVVGGTSELVRRAEARAASLGVSDRVRFVGTVPDPRPFLAAADLFALPSSYEAHSLAVLEALACGLGLVVTATGGASDVVVDGENGWLVDATGPSIANAIMRFVASDPTRVRDAARATAERYTWPSVADRYLHEIERLHTGQPVA
jgi:glycosyltransferase involved in cell wall biosynthesis